MSEVLLVGNPNTGKTTLFNKLTKSNEHIGNWHGVTVEDKRKDFFVGAERVTLVDTPGIYSLTPLSFEEGVACKIIADNADKKIINICDRNNLQRNLYLTLCLLEEGYDVVLAINEIDKKAIYKIDCKKLEEKLGISVVLIDPEKNVGIDKLKSLVLIENNKKKFELYDKTDDAQQMAKKRYECVEQLLSACASRTEQVYGKSKLDRLFLNKWLAIPSFFLILFGMFYLTFFCFGELFSQLLSSVFDIISSPILAFFQKTVGKIWIYDLIADALVGGVGTVLSFLPQVVLLFFFLSVLEDSGYLARIAFIFEDILGKIGLSGKSVYTLLMGFGCSTTAIMTARNMDDKNAKIKTAILCPYMSCTAKIPIYTVIGGAFFGAKNIFYVVGFYFLGVVVAILISKIFDKTILKSEKQSFILEFPPYRIPSIKRILNIISENLKTFLIKVGTVMISMNVIIWVLSSFTATFSYVPDCGGVSILETIGKILCPLFKPLGFSNWAIVASLLAGLVAKEVVVSSIAMFNGIESSATKLISQSIMIPASVVFFASQASVLSFLVFCLLYTPCIASVSMLCQEIGGKWTIVSIAIQLLVAYVLSFLTYNVAFACEIFGFWIVVFSVAAVLLVGASIFFGIRVLRGRRGCNNCQLCDKQCRSKKKSK